MAVTIFPMMDTVGVMVEVKMSNILDGILIKETKLH